jgi:hypothetical protein
MTPREHSCVGGYPSKEPSWWATDGRGIELCRVCDLCRDEKLARYRPEILRPYDESDVNEPIEPE